MIMYICRRKANDHVYLSQESKWSCIFVAGQQMIMYICRRKANDHVYLSQDSEWSCIFVAGKQMIMYICRSENDHVYLLQWYQFCFCFFDVLLEFGSVLNMCYFVFFTLFRKCITNDHWCVPLVVSTSRSFPHSRLITGFITKLTRCVPLAEQELPTLPGHLSSPPVFSGVCVTRSLVLCVCFVDRCLSFCTFSFGHCVVCSSSIYGFWLLLFRFY
jgi:hypothetical protein